MDDYLELRRMMAENGYEVTPAEAWVLTENFKKALDNLTSFESYIQYKNMTEADMRKYLSFYNKKVKKKDRMTLDEFKEFRELIIDVAEGNNG